MKPGAAFKRLEFERLGRPKNERPFLLLPVGYPAPDSEVPDIEKKPLEDVLEIK